MSTEVSAQAYLYRNTTYRPQLNQEQADAIKLAHRRAFLGPLMEDSEPDDDEEQETSTAIDKSNPLPEIKSTTPDVIAPFRHNPLHDLESVFWLALFILLCSTFVKDTSISDAQWQQYQTARRELARKLFSDREYRRIVMDSPDRFLQDINALHPQIREIARKLEINFGQVLVTRYREAEKDIPPGGIEFSVANDLYANFAVTLMDIEKSLRGSKDLKIAVHCISAQKELLQDQEQG